MKINDEMLNTVYYGNFKIPDHMKSGVLNYINHRIEPGSFLRSVFENDFVSAALRADSENLKNLTAYINFICFHAPRECWGSKEIVDQWLDLENE